MNTTNIHKILATGLLISPMCAMAEQPPAPEIPTGTLQVEGSKVSYGFTPTLTWSIQKPQLAREVIGITNNASLDIKIDSIIKIEAIGIGLSERNDQARGRIYVNGSPTIFYQGSQNNIYGITDWFWEPKNKYAAFDGDNNFNRYGKHDNSTTRPSQVTSNNDNQAKVVDFSPVSEADRIIDVSAGDTVNIVTEFWGGSYHYADSRDANQTQMISFFDGDLIPTTRTGDSGQQDLVEMLDNGYIKKVGNNTYKAVLRPNQMITMVDFNKTAVDINDFVYMLEVTGRDTLQDDPNYDYYIVKIDRTQRFVQYDVEGNPILPTDENGDEVITIDPGSDTFGFDEIHLIDGSEPVDQNNPTKYTYQFETPNGVYGSDYKLIAIYRGNGASGGSSIPGDVVAEDTEYELATSFLDSNGIIYEFDITTLKNQNYTIMGDSSDSISAFTPDHPVAKYSFNTQGKVAGLIPRPITQEELLVTPRGAYSVFFEHRQYTYVEGTTNDTNVGTTLEGGVEEINGDTDNSVYFSGELPTKDLWNTSLNHSNITPLIQQGKSGEEHFIQYAYRSIWALVNGQPQVVGSIKSEIGRKIVHTWAAPTAIFSTTNPPDNGTAYRQAPYFTCKINNIYPNGYVKILLTPVATANTIQVGGKIDSVSSTVITLEKKRVFRSANTKLRQQLNDALGNISGAKKVDDGLMRYDVVHYVDFDQDGVIDDTRIIASQEWILDRSVKVKGSSINTSE